MEGVILAAGKGERAWPLTTNFEKPLLPIANKSIIEYIINSFKDAGIKRLIIVVSQNSKIREIKKDNLEIIFVEQKQRIGTANALLVASNLINDDFIVVNADNIVSSSLLKRLKKRSGNILTLFKTNKLGELSSVKIENEKVKKIIEKPVSGEELSNLASIGTYAFTIDFLNFLNKVKKSKRGEYELPDAIQIAIDSGEDINYLIVKEFRHVTYGFELLRENEIELSKVKSKLYGKIEKDVIIDGSLVLEKNSIVKSGTRIEGKVIVGENCVIGPNSFLRGSTSIGNNVKIGQSVEIKNSIIMDNTKIPHLTYIGDSVIGHNCNFGAGSILTNLRFDNATIKIKIKGKEIDTGRRKLGAIVGHNVKTGSNVTILPGKLIGSNSLIYPGKVVYRNVKDGENFK